LNGVINHGVICIVNITSQLVGCSVTSGAAIIACARLKRQLNNSWKRLTDERCQAVTGPESFTVSAENLSRVNHFSKLELSDLNEHEACGFSLHWRSFLMARRPTRTSPSAELCWLALDIFDASSASGPGRVSQAVVRVKIPATARLDSAWDTVAILQLSNH
jgi:hypothetical protein